MLIISDEIPSLVGEALSFSSGLGSKPSGKTYGLSFSDYTSVTSLGKGFRLDYV